MAVTIYGVVAVTFMIAMYALERRGRGFVLAFALGCVLSSVYGFLSGAWPFGIAELIWAGVAFRRYRAPGQLLRLAAVAVLENFGLRQLESWWRLVALITWRGRPQTWHSTPRQGFQTAAAGTSG